MQNSCAGQLHPIYRRRSKESGLCPDVAVRESRTHAATPGHPINRLPSTQSESPKDRHDWRTKAHRALTTTPMLTVVSCKSHHRKTHANNAQSSNASHEHTRDHPRRYSAVKHNRSRQQSRLEATQQQQHHVNSTQQTAGHKCYLHFCPESKHTLPSHQQVSSLDLSNQTYAQTAGFTLQPPAA